jgi:hypothetical protein
MQPQHLKKQLLNQHRADSEYKEIEQKQYEYFFFFDEAYSFDRAVGHPL